MRFSRRFRVPERPGAPRLGLALVALVLVVAGCAGPSPTATPTPQPPATPYAAPSPSSPEPALTDTPAARSNPSGADTPADVWPLHIGATWIYSATLEYSPDGRNTIRLEGTITRTIVSQDTVQDVPVWSMVTEGFPLDRPETTQSGLVTLRNRVYALPEGLDAAAVLTQAGSGFESNILIDLPLTVGKKWGEPQQLARGDNAYVWRVDAQEPVTTSLGVLSGCFRLVYETNPDTTTMWFCPGVGFARSEYEHHGSPYREVESLVERR